MCRVPSLNWRQCESGERMFVISVEALSTQSSIRKAISNILLQKRKVMNSACAFSERTLIDGLVD